ncbi:MAG: hypothetical protein WC878_06790 [Candidatus Paceibacterota bacterium]|jgi:hypothetical protein
MKKFYFRSLKNLKEECEMFCSATLIALLVFSGTYAYDVFAANPETETLTVTIAPAVTFSVSTDSFGTLTPGTPLFATSTTNVTTNATSWYVTMYGNNQGSGAASTTLYLSPTTYATGIPDGVEWVNPTATTSVGNSAAISSGVDFLYFRVMTASGSVPFRTDTWWGTDYNFTTGLWAGIASSTVQRAIGYVTGYNASALTNTVQYYLDVGASQQQGAYTGDLTYTWVAGSI